MRYRILAVLSAFVLMGGFFVVTAQQAGAQQELSLVATQTNFVVIPAGQAATANPSNSYIPNTGDVIELRDTLTQGTTTVGFDNAVCTDTFNNNGLCTDVIAITGKGDIHLTALIRGVFSGVSPATFDATIDGGTFAYANASGDMHAVDVSPTETDYTLLIN
jgi:hypothetical protein